MIRLAVDTNVFVSLFIRPGTALSTLIEYIDHSAVILYSEDSLTELADVLQRQKFRRFVSIADTAALLKWILENGELIEITQTLVGSRDVTDNKFLSLAVAGQADYLISGDNDLLILGTIQGIPILKPADFMNAISH